LSRTRTFAGDSESDAIRAIATDRKTARRDARNVATVNRGWPSTQRQIVVSSGAASLAAHAEARVLFASTATTGVWVTVAYG
jgi:hypothetical protein